MCSFTHNFRAGIHRVRDGLCVCGGQGAPGEFQKINKCPFHRTDILSHKFSVLRVLFVFFGSGESVTNPKQRDAQRTRVASASTLLRVIHSDSQKQNVQNVCS